MNDSAEKQSQNSRFFYVICQNGAESALKSEISKNHPSLNLAFSRPGFVTFKDVNGSLPEKFFLRSTIARTYGWSLGKVRNESAAALIDDLLKEPKIAEAKHVHVWERDPSLPGKDGFEPGISVLASEVCEQIKTASPAGEEQLFNRIANPDDLVFDVVLVEPNEWWFGYHFANTIPGRWPGGVPKVDPTKPVSSRAYFKLKEALLWAGINISNEDVCAEIGSSPGGACELLLEKGAGVLGIDPAEMEQSVLDHPNFIHIRKRGHEVRKREFSDVNWLLADLNMAPGYTLDTIEGIVSHESVNVSGLILTLKLSDWKTLEEIPKYFSRVKGWGFQVVKSRQLAFNRQEFCLVAIKDKFLLRDSVRKQKLQRAKIRNVIHPDADMAAEPTKQTPGNTEAE